MLSTYELRKGFEFLFNVFKELSNDSPDVNLVICGDSTKKEKSVVEQLRKNIAPKSKIHLLDFVPNGKALINQADILISACGKSKLIKKDWIKEGVIIIDVGINRDENNKLCGDIDYNDVIDKVKYITPVPGGVGPITVSILLNNLVKFDN